MPVPASSAYFNQTMITGRADMKSYSASVLMSVISGSFSPPMPEPSRSRLGTDIDPRFNTLYSTRRKRIDPVDQLTAQRTAGLDECFILKAHAFHDQFITHGTKPTDNRAPHLFGLLIAAFHAITMRRRFRVERTLGHVSEIFPRLILIS